MSIHKEDLEKLAPEERIKKLKQMEEQRKKEVMQIEELIKKSLQEMRTNKIADEISPQQKPVDISRLFEPSHHFDSGIKKVTNEAPDVKYEKTIQVYDDYSKLKHFYGLIATGSSLSEDQKAAVGKIGERITTAEKYMSESEKLASILDASRIVLYKLKKETGLS